MHTLKGLTEYPFPEDLSLEDERRGRSSLYSIQKVERGIMRKAYEFAMAVSTALREDYISIREGERGGWDNVSLQAPCKSTHGKLKSNPEGQATSCF